MDREGKSLTSLTSLTTPRPRWIPSRRRLQILIWGVKLLVNERRSLNSSRHSMHDLNAFAQFSSACGTGETAPRAAVLKTCERTAQFQRLEKKLLAHLNLFVARVRPNLEEVSD
jgi:hypothetical protein